MRFPISICLAAACLLAAVPARAQVPFQVWIEGRYIQDQDQTRDNTVQTGPGSGIAGGIDFLRRFGIHVAVDLPEEHVERVEMIYQDRGAVHRVDTISHRAPSVSVSFSANVVTTSRVRVTLLGGLAKVRMSARYQFVIERVGASREVLSQSEGREQSTLGGLSYGAEFPVRLVRGLSIVPSIHGVHFPLADYGRNGGPCGRPLACAGRSRPGGRVACRNAGLQTLPATRGSCRPATCDRTDRRRRLGASA